MGHQCVQLEAKDVPLSEIWSIDLSEQIEDVGQDLVGVRT